MHITYVTTTTTLSGAALQQMKDDEKVGSRLDYATKEVTDEQQHRWDLSHLTDVYLAIAIVLKEIRVILLHN